MADKNYDDNAVCMLMFLPADFCFKMYGFDMAYLYEEASINKRKAARKESSFCSKSHGHVSQVEI